KLGAASPDAAAREFVTAMSARNWNKMLSLFAPNEAPVYDYRAALGHMLDNMDRLTVGSLDVIAEQNGSHRTVSVTASGTYTNTDGTQGQWHTSASCVDVAGGSRPARYAGFCLPQQGTGVLIFRAVNGNSAAPLKFDAVKESGRWYLSPVNTALDA